MEKIRIDTGHTQVCHFHYSSDLQHARYLRLITGATNISLTHR